MESLLRQFREQSAYYFDLNLPRINACLNLVSEREAWYRSNEHTNSMGNLVLHLCGNISQYVLSGLGGAPDTRQREQEFSRSEGFSKAELFEKLTGIHVAACAVIRSLDEARLLASYRIQGFELTGVSVVIHVTEHFSYHTGQIALIAKTLKNADTGFYRGVDLNLRNE